jgi:hypothetical protein
MDGLLEPSTAFGTHSRAQATREHTLVRRVAPPQVRYENWNEFSHLLFAVQHRYCECLVISVRMDLEKVSLDLGNVKSFGFQLSHLREQGPSILMQLTKQEGAYWCSMVAHFVCSRVLRAAAIYHNALAHLTGEDGTYREPSVRCKMHVLEVMQQEVRYTFSTAMPFSIYTLSSGFVSTLMIDNFEFYDDADLTAFTVSEIECLLLTLCMGLHWRLGMNSPLLVMQDELVQSICARLRTSRLRAHVAFNTREELLWD